MMFKRRLATAVMLGAKTATRRPLSNNPNSPWYRERCTYTVGKRFSINPGRGVTNIGHARVTRCECVRLGHLTRAQAIAEGVASPADFEATWRELHKGAYNPDELVWLIEFEVCE